MDSESKNGALSVDKQGGERGLHDEIIGLYEKVKVHGKTILIN